MEFLPCIFLTFAYNSMISLFFFFSVYHPYATFYFCCFFFPTPFWEKLLHSSYFLFFLNVAKPFLVNIFALVAFFLPFFCLHILPQATHLNQGILQLLFAVRYLSVLYYLPIFCSIVMRNFYQTLLFSTVAFKSEVS